jgi:hypothetical protein
MGFSGNPPTPPGTLPDIPVPSFDGIGTALSLGMKAAGWFDDFWRSHFEHKIAGGSSNLAVLASALDDLVAGAMSVLTSMQGTNTPGFFTLVAATLTDLLGVPFDAGALQSSFRTGGDIAGVRKIGATFLGQLISEMAPQGQITPASGLAAANAFLGYVIGFAVRQGNVAVLSELLPTEIDFLGGLREYGEVMAQALGLGRLSREVLRSMMKVLVTDPITWFFNQQYRPTMMGVSSMIKSYWRGGLSQDDLTTYLQWLGYRDVDIPQLQLEAETLVSEAALLAMNRVGLLDSATLATELTRHGVPAANVPFFIAGTTAQRAETHLNSAVANYLSLYKNRWIQHDDLVTQLGALGLSQVEIQYCLGEVAPFLEYQTKELSQSEIETAYLSGLVDLEYYANWAVRYGYSLPDQQILQYLLLLKQNKETTAAEIAQWRLRIACLNAKAKGQPPPPGFDADCNPTS